MLKISSLLLNQIDICFCIVVVYWRFIFNWPLRKQAAYKQATRGPTALGLFRGTIGNEDKVIFKVPCPRALLPLQEDLNRGPHG